MTKGSQKASIGLPVAIAIVVANMVGTGVFTSLGFQVADIPTGFPILLLWALGGIIAFCGAVCYAELGSMMPRSGGEYHLLSEGMHPAVGFVSGWVSVFAGFTAPIAAAALAFAAYFTESSGLNPSISKAAAIGVIVVISAIHLGPVKHTGRFQVLFTSFKILLMLILIIAAFSVGESQSIRFIPQSGDVERIFSGGFAISLFWVMYAYAGWNAAAYVIGEIKHPERTLPIALLVGTAVVTVLYLAVNAAFLHSTPVPAMAGKIEVGMIAAEHIFGQSGGRMMGGLISVGLISTISAMIWAGPRVVAVMGEDFSAFRLMSRRNQFGVPANAIFFQTGVAILCVIVPTFDQLINYVMALLTLSSALVVITVVSQRIRFPEKERPYHAFGYPITPIIFLAASGWMLWHGLFQKTTEMIAAGTTILIGLMVFYFLNKTDRKR